ncbi:GNAT family N-acetyltransferase [Catellatospora methionotrophica]|uniref:GNAT family N-acetyltransferase n=1 Tax=Catellatospora methionotrophica TaxID=121620 RepID=UPI0033E24155
MITREDDVRIRPATAADAPTVGVIWRDGWRDGHLGHVPEELVAIRTPESFDLRAAQRVADTTVAEVGNEVAGFVMVVADEVEQVYVAADRRGTGVAGTLLAEGLRQVGANGHGRAWLAVVSGNTRARRFYEREGWTDEGAFDYPARSSGGPISVPCHRYTRAA